MTEREKMIKVLRDNIEYELRDYPNDHYVGVTFNYGDIVDALIAANIGDVTEWKEKVECAKRILQIPTLPNGTTDLSYFEYKGERIQDIVRLRDEYKHRAEVAEKERDEWKERAERMHKEALKQKERVSDYKHSEDTMRNQIECAMGMASEMEHVKRAFEILYMSGAITEEALRGAVKQAKLEIEEEEADDR